MLHGLYISAAGLKVNDVKQSVQANNLANVQTTGFKPDRVPVFARAMAAEQAHPGSKSALIPELMKIGGGVYASHTLVDLRAGSLELTGNTLDVALDTGSTADGFLSIAGPDGSARWTRDGRMTMGLTGELTLVASGAAVLDADGEPIKLNPAGGEITIDRQGIVLQGGAEVARLGLAGFEEPHQLLKQGFGQFVAPASAKPGRFDGTVLQGYLESAAVDPTRMLADMISTQRAYEANANMIKYQDQTLARAVNDLGRVA